MTFFYQPFSPNDVDFFPLVFTTLYDHSVEDVIMTPKNSDVKTLYSL